MKINNLETTPLFEQFEENLTGNDFVVGDIHGCFSILEAKLKESGFDYSNDRLFCIGDLIDRGAENERCLEFLSFDWFYSICGNHEEMLINYYFSSAYDKKRYTTERMIAGNGNKWFFDLPVEKQKPFIDAFIKLPIAMQIKRKNKTFGLVHAEISRLADDNWNEFIGQLDDLDIIDSALWGRARMNSKDCSTIKNIDWVIHGHTPIMNKTILGNRVYIDTGCVYNKNLTVLDLDDLIL